MIATGWKPRWARWTAAMCLMSALSGSPVAAGGAGTPVPTPSHQAAAQGAAKFTVWLPTQGQTGTLSPAGLVGAGGNRVVLTVPGGNLPREVPLRGAFARLVDQTRQNPTRLEVIVAGRVSASRAFPDVTYNTRLLGTDRGPCLAYTETNGGASVTRCFTPDLKTEWVRLGWVLAVTRDGRAAYLNDPATVGVQRPYSPDVSLLRQDLGTGTQTPLTFRVPLTAEELEYHRNLADTLDAREFAWFGPELPGGRFLMCATMTLPKMGCRLDIVGRDLRRTLTLRGAAYNGMPEVTRDGTRLYYLGNTLQVWDARTGARVQAIRDPLWEGRRQVPVRAFLTPDGQQAAVIVAGLQNNWPDPRKLAAYVYRLKDGRLLTTFPVKP